jgi:hypothetical protein
MPIRGFALVLIGLGLILLSSGLGYAIYVQRVEQVGSAPIPGELAGLPLTGEISSRSAIAELAWMHGQGFKLNKGSVGTYGRDGEITLYVAGTPFKFMAGRLLTAMRDKIAEVDSPFTQIAEHDIEQHEVYELEGMGQMHFYFRSNDLIVWLAVDHALASEALQQALDFYP